MLEVKKISINDFLYDLPDEKIAKYPLAKRDNSKLLIYQNGVIKESIYDNIATEIPAESLLVFNNTKVVEARLLFEKETGGKIEIFCLEPADNYPDITTAMLQRQKVLWKCLVGGAKKWKEEVLILLIKNDTVDFKLEAKKIEKHHDYFLIEFNWTAEQLSFAEILHVAGQIPLPPYLNRAVEEQDKETYQTIYAQHDGSVAAPTAGLHFTEGVFKSLKEKKIEKDFVTLHVGAGTFKPVKADVMDDHEMHYEFIDVSTELIQHLIQKINDGKKVIAVGTTSLRTIESLYWIGMKANSQKSLVNSLEQWECYDLSQTLSATQSLQAILNYLQSIKQSRFLAKTQIIIAPGYQFKIADGLITNFHQPKSTLLLLVAALVGKDWKKIYDFALQNEFRFLSYGDGSLLWKK